MSDRRQAGSQVDAMKTSTSAQIDQISAVRRALGQIREGLWTSDEPPPDDDNVS
jgi:hypothetical protein